MTRTHLQTCARGASLARTIIALAVAVAIVMLASAAGFYFFVIRPPLHAAQNLAHEISAGFEKKFHFTPTVIENEKTVIEQTTPALKLTTVQRRLSETIEWSQTWAGSTKTIVVEGIYAAGAGFDLEKHLRVSISGNPPRVTADFPEAELLSLDVKKYRVLKDENGWWNKISTQERESLMNRLHAQARKKAEESGILSEAKAAVEKRLAEIASAKGCEVQFRYRAPEPPGSVEPARTTPAAETSPRAPAQKREQG